MEEEKLVLTAVLRNGGCSASIEHLCLNLPPSPSPKTLAGIVEQHETDQRHTLIIYKNYNLTT